MLGNKSKKQQENIGFPGFTEDNDVPDIEVNKETLAEDPKEEPKKVEENPKSESLGTTKPEERAFLQVISGEILPDGTTHYGVISNRALGIGQKIYLQ